MATSIDLEMTTAALATALGHSLAEFNKGVYEGTNIRIRQMTGAEVICIRG